MIILGVTSDDKGAQLEALVSATLGADGYAAIAGNVVGAGGDELDVTAELRSNVLTQEHVTPVVCEAKAYGKAVVLPIWHKFLGKIFIARATNSRAIGVLIALNGVSGNVRGNFNSLSDTGLFIVDGRDLQSRATDTGEIAPEAEALSRIGGAFFREPERIELAYYGGRYYWIATWVDGSYSVVDGRGEVLPTEQIERIQSALSASVAGELLATAEARIRAERRHADRVRLISRLIRGESLQLSDIPSDDPDLFDELSAEPFVSRTGNALVALDPSGLSPTAISRFFICLFQANVPVRLLGFVADGSHRAYVERLIDSLSELHPGLSLDATGDQQLRALAPSFPSIWLTVALPNTFLTAQRDEDEPEMSPEDARRVELVNQNAFWESVIGAIRSDFVNPNLRGFLFDHLHVAELEEHRTLTVKTWERALGSASAETRDVLGSLSAELAGDAGTGHIVIRALPGMAEPWEMEHPGAVVELERNPQAQTSEAESEADESGH